MKRFWGNGWNYICSYFKNRTKIIGILFIALGICGLTFQAVLFLFCELRTERGLIGISLGFISVGVALVAIGMSAESDKRYTEILQRLDRNVAQLPLLLKGDLLTVTGQLIAKETVEKQNKEAAQRRLDEDTQNVGYQRGELFRNEDGSWGIHWGGKWPL